MSEKSIKIYTLGCKVNQYDTAYLAAKLKDNNFHIFKENADFAVVNTCAVTKTALKKNKSMINRARKENPDAKIFIIGCWPKTYELDFEAKKIEILDNRNLDSILKRILDEASVNIQRFKEASSLVATDKAKYFIKIQDGCEQFCSYCIIPYARGKIKSRDKNEIIKETNSAILRGYKEFVLTGIHLGQYGKDLKNANLCDLLRELLKMEGLGRIRLSSIEANEVTEELIGLIKNSKKICKHLHIPLQAGCDKILKLMSRPYDTNFFKNKVKQIRKAMPDISLTTDVITGFPGETDNDFLATYNLIKEINFSRLHVFPFSAHEKTAAFNFPDQIDRKIKDKRAAQLRELNLILQENYRKKFNNKTCEILVEYIGGKKIRGKTEHYIDIILNQETDKSAKVGDLIKIKV